MKKLVLFFAAAVAISFASCGTKTTETTPEEVEGTATEVVDSVNVEAPAEAEVAVEAPAEVAAEEAPVAAE